MFGRWWKGVELRRVAALAEQGLSAAEIAKKVTFEWDERITRKAVYSVCRTHGIALHGKVGRPRSGKETLTPAERKRCWRRERRLAEAAD